MFKTLTLYRYSKPDRVGIEFGMQALPFRPCGPTEPRSAGFVPPRGHANGALFETVGDHAVAKVQIEQRILPASVVRSRVDDLAKQIERETGRKPGTKRRRELKDEALLDLLPKAFTRQRAVWVWFDHKAGILAIDQTSVAIVDEVLTLLVRAIPELQLGPLQTAEAPAACMREWLADGIAPMGFGLGREAVLQAADATGGSVRYSKHALEGSDVEAHLQAGKQVKTLALNWKDRVDFTLDEAGRLRKIKLDDGVFSVKEGEQDVDPFDANLLLTTSELGPMIEALLEGFGGALPPQFQETPK